MGRNYGWCNHNFKWNIRFIAPRISIADRKHNVYKIEENSDLLCETKIKIKLTNSKFYGNYYYIGRNKNKVIEGIVAKDKNPFFQFNLIKKTLLLLFSEILLFPYAIGAFIFHIKNSKLIVKLDSIMEQHNCLKLHQKKEKYYRLIVKKTKFFNFENRVK